MIQKCVLEGQSYRQVSEELGIPLPTVASHLRRGRSALSKRLLVRGVGVAGVVAAMTSLSYATEAPSQSVCAATVQNAELLLAGDYASLPARIVSLMKGVATSMTITAKYVLALVLTLTGATTWWMSSDNADQQPGPAAQTVQAGPSIEPTLVLEQHPSALEATIHVPGPVNGTPTIEASLEPTLVLNQSTSALELNIDVPGPVKGTPTIELVPSYR